MVLSLAVPACFLSSLLLPTLLWVVQYVFTVHSWSYVVCARGGRVGLSCGWTLEWIQGHGGYLSVAGAKTRSDVVYAHRFALGDGQQSYHIGRIECARYVIFGQTDKENHLRVLDMRKVTGISDFSLECGIWESRCICPFCSLLARIGCEFVRPCFWRLMSIWRKWICPMGLLSVGNYAFRHCSSLSVADLPFGLRKLGNYAFMGVANWKISAIQVIIISCWVIFLQQWWQVYHCLSRGQWWGGFGIAWQYSQYRDWRFASSVNLSAVTLPQALKSIGDSAFADCQSLSAINIPGSVTYFGMGAFIQDSSLMTLHIAEGVKYIGNSACPELFCTQLHNNGGQCGEYWWLCVLELSADWEFHFVCFLSS